LVFFSIFVAKKYTMEQHKYISNAKILVDTPVYYASYIEIAKTIVCGIKNSYIRKDDFEKLFNLVAEESKIHGVEKIIFDKRQMKVFDQPSMVWYHLTIKENLFKSIGLKKYRKLLPTDELFRMSVEIGKTKIAREYDFDFTKFDIQYCETIDEAFDTN
jgi:hypothetical protein